MKLIKLFIWLAGALALVLVAAAVAVVTLVDPNDFKPEITAAVEKQTGRSFAIDGDIAWTFTPWLGLKLGAITLGNAKGFGTQSFASLSEAEIRVALTPLFSKQLVMDRVRVEGLSITLVKNKSGKTNWEDLIAGPKVEQPATDSTGGVALAGFAIGGVDIRDARLVWDDRELGVRYELANLNVETGALKPGEPVKLAMGFDFTRSRPKQGGRLEISGVLSADPKVKRYALSDLKISVNARGEGLPPAGVQATLAAQLNADLAAQTLALSDFSGTVPGARLNGSINGRQIIEAPVIDGQLVVDKINLSALAAGLGQSLPKGVDTGTDDRISAKVHFDQGAETLVLKEFKANLLNMSISGNLTGQRVMSAPVFSGGLTVAVFSPREVLAALGQVAPKTTDPKVLTRASASLDVSATKERVDLSNLILKLDDTEIRGKFALRNFEKPAYTFTLDIDAIDLDRYLPSGQQGADRKMSPAPTTAAAPGSEAGLLPVDMLRGLDLTGRVRIGKLKKFNLRVSDIQMSINAKQGRVEIAPVTARLYEGRYNASVLLDARKQQPQMRVNAKLSRVQIEPLLIDLQGKSRLSGVADINADLDTAGNQQQVLKQNLNGTARFSFRNGAIKGVNIAQLIREANARLKGRPVPKQDAPNQTDFTELSGSARIVNGLVHNQDLKAKSPLLRVGGKGTANLVSEQIDYLVKTTVVGNLSGQGGVALKDLKGVPIPVRIKGSFDKPEYSLDLAAVLEGKVKQEVKRKVKKKIKEKFGDQLKKGIGEKLKGFKLPF